VSQQNKKFIFLIPLATAITTLILFFTALVNNWMGEPVGAGANFCEAPHDGLIIQPFNTWSNLGFIFTGLFIGFALSKGAYSKNKNALTQKTFYATFFATLVVLLGPGSMAMHATTTSVGGYLDMLSMYLVAAFIAAYAIERFFSLSPLQFLIVFGSVVAICLYFQTLPYKIPVVGFMGSFIFAVFLIIGGVFETLNSFVRKMQHEIKWGIYSVVAMLLAFLIWNLSLSTSPYCDPSTIVQGHGIWHILNAVSVYCLFRYYVSEHKE
jgi:hypothetical protein